MEKGQKVYDFYVGDTFDRSRGLVSWLDELTVEATLNDNEVICRTRYGTPAVRPVADLFTNSAAATEAMISRLEERARIIQNQIQKLRDSITTAEVVA